MPAVVRVRRAACAFYICIRVIFALTAFPFALFEAPHLPLPHRCPASRRCSRGPRPRATRLTAGWWRRTSAASRPTSRGLRASSRRARCATTSHSPPANPPPFTSHLPPLASFFLSPIPNPEAQIPGPRPQAPDPSPNPAPRPQAPGRAPRPHQARRHLGARVELQLLQRAAAAARRHLRSAPHEGKWLGRRRIEELEGLLTSLVPPTHTLFGTVFPDKMLCLQYKQRIARADPAAGAPFSRAARAARARTRPSTACSGRATRCRRTAGCAAASGDCSGGGTTAARAASSCAPTAPAHASACRGLRQPQARVRPVCSAARRDLPACEPTDGRVYRGGGGGETLGDEPRRSASEASDVDPEQARLRELL